jgi:hypothetical protein
LREFPDSSSFSTMAQSVSGDNGGTRGDGGGQLVRELEALSQALYKAGHAGGPHSRVVLPNAISSSSPQLGGRESMPDLLPGITALSHAQFTSRLQYLRPPVASKPNSSPPVHSSKVVEEIQRQGIESPRPLHTQQMQPRHSQGFEKHVPEMTNLPEWVEHNFGFSHKPEDPQTEKKKSVWTWKPFRAIAHIGQQKFCCLFTVHVHGIEQLPSSMNGLRLTIQFGRREDAIVQTAPAKVLQGAAEFEETLSVKSTVYGSKSGSQGMKYQAKQFILSLIAPDEDLVLGKTKLDLTRLLPKILDEDEDKQVTWTTSFKLMGEAQGGTLVVTFRCNILGNDASLLLSSSSQFGESPVLRAVGSFNSSPGGVHAADADFTSPATSESGAEYPGMEHLSLDDPSSTSPSRLENSALRGPMRSDAKASPVRSFSQSDQMLGPSTPGQSEADYSELGKVTDFENEEEDEPGFTIVDQGVEVGSLLDPVSARTYVDAGADKEEHVDGSYSVALEAQESAELGAHAKKGEHADAGNQTYQNTQIYREDFEIKILAQELENKEEARLMDDELEMQELLAALDGQEYFYDEQGYEPNSGLKVPEEMTDEELSASFLPGHTEPIDQPEHIRDRSKTAKADDEFNPVTGEFLDLLESEVEPGSVALASDSEPDSPRAVLLKQFEQEAMLEGGLGVETTVPHVPVLHSNNSEACQNFFNDMPINLSSEVQTLQRASHLDDIISPG